MSCNAEFPSKPLTQNIPCYSNDSLHRLSMQEKMRVRPRASSPESLQPFFWKQGFKLGNDPKCGEGDGGHEVPVLQVEQREFSQERKLQPG